MEIERSEGVVDSWWLIIASQGQVRAVPKSAYTIES
jgi:hypothetical protein